MLVVSTDDLETQKKFKEKLQAPYPFVADPEGDLVKLYGVDRILLNYAKRRTFVIGTDGKVAHIDDGSDAIDPEGAIRAALKLVHRTQR